MFFRIVDVLMGLLFVEVMLGGWTSCSGMVQQCFHELKMDSIQFRNLSKSDNVNYCSCDHGPAFSYQIM
ncbi:hypothetical protein SADUNF_Sadunf18G0110000 [Salix dunnii]|uniref:Uncharacterized protein n=1 Tax=Salix dunnii TaxID=1413687 RepID=A0A835ME91_9ROSI|nr:hypothetical protein SADUNF_Sadunf18G0110000 [Salix dunnii]